MSAEVGSLVPGPSSRRWRCRQFLSSLHLRVGLGRNVTPLWLLPAGLLVVKVLNHCGSLGGHVLGNCLPIRAEASQ